MESAQVFSSATPMPMAARTPCSRCDRFMPSALTDRATAAPQAGRPAQRNSQLAVGDPCADYGDRQLSRQLRQIGHTVHVSVKCGKQAQAVQAQIHLLCIDHDAIEKIIYRRAKRGQRLQ